MAWTSRWFGIPRPVDGEDVAGFFRIQRILIVLAPAGMLATGAGFLLWGNPIIGSLLCLGSPLMALAMWLQVRAYERYWDDRFP